jgi:hypothetical protein
MTSIILSCKIWKLGNWNAETIGESTGDSGALNCAFQRLRTATDDGLRRPTLHKTIVFSLSEDVDLKAARPNALALAIPEIVNRRRTHAAGE